MKEVAPAPPPECNWTGFYIGINAGYAWMDSEVSDLDFLNVGPPVRSFSFDSDGPVAGGQVGYNFQPLRWLVLGVEGDAGYLGVDGRKTQPGSPGGLTFAEINPGTYATARGRIGMDEIVHRKNPGDPYKATPHIRDMLRAKMKQ